MIKRGGIGNNRKENPHRGTTVDDLGILRYANRFGETSTASADPRIAAWPSQRAAIAGNRLADALHMRKHTLHAPKASPCKNSVFQFLLGWSIHLRLWRQHCLFSRKRQGYGKIVMPGEPRSEEHTSELQSLMRISYAVFCLKKTKTNPHKTRH